MRGLLNDNIARFEADNSFGFPSVPAFYNYVDTSVPFVDFDVCSSVPSSNRPNRGVHCFCDDYKLNRLWSDPVKYVSLLSSFKYVVMPDFSLYFDFPQALQIYNKFRNHWLAAFCSCNNIPVIPNISPSLPSEYYWSFLGYPKNSVVAFSDIGCRRKKEDFRLLIKGYDEMIKRLEPVQILYFTRSNNAPSECDIVRLPLYKGGEING